MNSPTLNAANTSQQSVSPLNHSASTAMIPEKTGKINVAVDQLASDFSTMTTHKPSNGKKVKATILPNSHQTGRNSDSKIFSLIKLIFAYIEHYLRSKYFSDSDVFLSKLYPIRDRLLKDKNTNLEIFKAAITCLKSAEKNKEILKYVVSLLAEESILTDKQKCEVEIFLKVGNTCKALDVIKEALDHNNELSKKDGLKARTITELFSEQGYITEQESNHLKGSYKLLSQEEFVSEIKTTLKKKLEEDSQTLFLRNLFITEILNEIQSAKTISQVNHRLAPLMYIIDFSKRIDQAISDPDSRESKFKELKDEFDLGFKTGLWDGNISNYFPLQYANNLGIIKKKLHKFKAGEPDKHNALIYTCSFGTGHKRTAEAIASYISENWQSSIVDNSEKTLSHCDTFRKLFGVSSPTMFNKLLEKQKYNIISIWTSFMRLMHKIIGIKTEPGLCERNTPITDKRKVALLQNILINRPDVIVTTYHMDLNPIIEISEKLGVPLAHVATDMNPKMDKLFQHNEPVTHPHFKLSLPMENEWIRKQSRPLNENQVEVCGFPIRKEFYELKATHLETFKKQRKIDSDTKVIFMMGGGSGQELPFPELIANNPQYANKKYHVIVVAGNNNSFAESLKNKLNPVKEVKDRIELKGANEGVTIELLQDDEPDQNRPYRVGGKKIAEAIGASDKCLIKPGGLSTFESLYLGASIIADARNGWLEWEKENIKNVVEYEGRGESLENIRELPKLLDSSISNDFKSEKYERFPTKFLSMIDNLYQKAATDQNFVNILNTLNVGEE